MARHELVMLLVKDTVLTTNVRDLPIAVTISKTYKDDIMIIERKTRR